MVTPASPDEFDAWEGLRVVARDGEPLGTLLEVYHDVAGGNPRWAAMQLYDGRHGFVPVGSAVQRGDEVHIPASLALVREAAATLPPTGQLTAEEEDRLEAHYATERSSPPTAPPPAAPPPPVEHDVELTVNEEQLVVTTSTHPAGVVRVRKVVVTEDVTVTVTLRREELRLESAALPDPVPGGAADPAEGEATMEDGDSTLLEVTLFEEVPVVQRRVVPRERVTVRRAVVGEQVNITEPVRRERLDIDESGAPG
jgi:uncharacterized protein (TIGR02271 family)